LLLIPPQKMVRPRLFLRIMFKPTARYFKPREVHLRNLEEVELKKDELDAISYKIEGLL